MKSLKLKNGSYITTDASHRYQLPNSRTDAPSGLHELPDGTILKVDQNGRVVTVTNATQQPIKIEDVSPITRKMAEVKPVSKTKQPLPDPTKVYTSQQAVEIQRQERLAERLKTYERLKKRNRAEAIAKKPAIRFR